MAFSFKGLSAEQYGLKVSVLQPPQRAKSKSEAISIPGRPEPLIRNYEEYDTVELTFEAVVTDPSRVRDIFAWLKGPGKLIYDDEPDKYYNALSNQLISVTRISDEIRSFQIKFTCLPFAMSVITPTETFSFAMDTGDDADAVCTESVTIDINGSYPCEPLWCITFAGYLEISVNGSSDKLILDTFRYDTDGSGYTKTFFTTGENVYKYIPEKVTLYIDTSLRTAYTLNGTTKVIHNELTSGVFPLIPVGKNEITFTVKGSEIFKHTVNDVSNAYRYARCNLSSVKITKNERWL